MEQKKEIEKPESGVEVDTDLVALPNVSAVPTLNSETSIDFNVTPDSVKTETNFSTEVGDSAVGEEKALIQQRVEGDNAADVSEETHLSQHEAKEMLKQLINVFDSQLSVEDTQPNDNIRVSERTAACGAMGSTCKNQENSTYQSTSHEEKVKLAKVFSMWKASKDPNCSPALPHILTVLMYTSSLYYPLRSHSLDFCLLRCLEYSSTLKKFEDYELWSKICDFLPDECSMTRTCMKMRKIDVVLETNSVKVEAASKAGPLFYLYSALFHLHIADNKRFEDKKSYFNKKWWEENYKPALHAVDEALKLVQEDDYSLHRLLTYISSYCRAVALVLLPTRSGRCHLCDDRTTLAASHIVPHFFLRKVPKPMCFHHRHLCALQDDVKKYALCGSKSKKLFSCEALFGEWETRFSKVYSELQFKGSAPYTFEYKEWLPLFAYSVAWRLLLLANANAPSANYQHPDWFNNVKFSLASFLTQPSEVHNYPIDVLSLPWMFMTKYEDIPVHLEGPMINQIVHLACGGPSLQQVGKCEFIFIHLMEITFLFPITDNPVVPASWEPFRLETNGIAHSVPYVNLPVEVKRFIKETYSREVAASYAGANLTIKWKTSASVNDAAERWLNKPPVWVLTPCVAQFSFTNQRFVVYTPFSLCTQTFSLDSDDFMCIMQLCKEKDRHILLMAYVEKHEPYSTVLLALLLPLLGTEKWCTEKMEVYPSPQVTDHVTVQKEILEFLEQDTNLGSKVDEILSTWQQGYADA